MTTSKTASTPAAVRPPGGPPRLDRLIRARAIHSMTGEVYRSVGLRGAKIAATSPEPDGLDDLAGTGTLTTDAGDLTLLPAFADAHEHLMEASRNTLLVPVHRARSIAEFTALVAAAARDAAPGAWIMTHSRPVPEKPSARWMCGKATFTIVASSTTISCAAAITASARLRSGGHRRRWPRAAPQMTHQT
jgi:hypothetical protein